MEPTHGTEADTSYLLPAAEARALLDGAPWSRLAILGDSVAEGVTEPYPGYGAAPWSHHLLTALRAVRPGLRHLGLGRRHLLTAEVRRTQLAEALEFGPDLVVALCGGNDALRREFDPDATESELHALLAPLAGTGATLVTSGFFDIAANPHFDERYRSVARGRLAVLSSRMRAVADRLDAVCLDMGSHPSCQDPSIWSTDGIHLNARGQAVLGTEIVRGLARRLRAPAGVRGARDL
ncbi:SGNH/GDSL hydrolase family protein [Streptomyces sp. NPDC048172]|uniref:SGNH/GDSL hydrolase family protein n=1 Tax=Streptomyces sp. NPDC048172 TaxID=3365505 RepID=UPI003722209D